MRNKHANREWTLTDANPKCEETRTGPGDLGSDLVGFRVGGGYPQPNSAPRDFGMLPGSEAGQGSGRSRACISRTGCQRTSAPDIDPERSQAFLTTDFIYSIPDLLQLESYA